MENSGVTIIIPIYNVGNYLDNMLKSIFNQTFKDFNVVLVNDGSTDNSEDIIIEYNRVYHNIIYIKQENRGVSEARNAGIEKISAKYTLFLDPDDFIDETMIEKMYNKAEQTNADIVICGYETISDNLKTEINKFQVDEKKVYTNIEVMDMMLNWKVEGQLWNKLFLSENILNSDVKFEKGRIIEDLFPVFNQVSMANKIVFVNEPLYKYIYRKTSLLNSNKEMIIMEDQNFAYKSIIDLIIKQKKIPEDKYLSFVAFVQCSHIKSYIEFKFKYNKKIYEKFKVYDYTLKDIIKSKVSIKVKIKLLLFKIKVLHILYIIYFKFKNL